MAIEDIQAIVLAAGRGSRMTELVSSKPKCLFPVGGRPMIFYPLHLLETARFSEVLICVLENQEEEISEAIAGLTAMKVIFFPVPKDDDVGTVDTLRLLDEREKIKSDFLLISCDTLTNFSLTNMINVFRIHNPTLTALISPSYIALEGSTPGRKGKPDLERDIIAIDSKNKNQLVFFQSELEFDEELLVKISMLRKCPNFDLSSSYLDSHVYIIKKWVLNYLKENRKFKSIKSDLIPYLVGQQFKSAKKARNLPDHQEKSKVELADCVETDEISNLLQTLDRLYVEEKDLDTKINPEATYPHSKVKCFAVIPDEGICIRANTVTGYFEAHKRLKAIFQDLDFDDKKESHPPASPAPSSAPQIGPDCVVSSTVKFGREKVSVKKSFIGKDCEIGEKVKIANSIIMNGVKIEANCNIQGSIICQNSSIGASVEMKDCIVTAGHKIVGLGKFSNEVLPSMATAYEM